MVLEEKAVKKALYRIFEECGIFDEIRIPAYGLKADVIAEFYGSSHHPEPTKDLWKVFKRFYKQEKKKIK